MARREVPEINAGSMADIAFLLLIFFLVTTTMDVDGGIQRNLPPIVENDKDTPPIRKKNLFNIKVNSSNQILVNGEIMEVKNIREEVKKFIDNNGDGTCEYCKGQRNPESSDNPEKAVVSLQNDRGTSFEIYIKIQNEVLAAYNELRNELCLLKYGKNFNELNPEKDKSKIDYITKEAYPLKFSEAEPLDVNA